MINDLLKDSGVEVLEPRIIKGIQLDDPTVILGNGNNYRAKDGNLNFKDKVKSSVKFNDWVIVYSQGKNAGYDDNDADSLAALIKEAAKAFSIKF